MAYTKIKALIRCKVFYLREIMAKEAGCTEFNKAFVRCQVTVICNYTPAHLGSFFPDHGQVYHRFHCLIHVLHADKLQLGMYGLFPSEQVGTRQTHE